MANGFSSVPFKTETNHGLTSVNGIAKFSSAGVVLEFEAKLFGIIGGGVKEVRLPIAEIMDVRFRKGFFKHGAKIVIRTQTMAALAELPNQDGKLTLKLAKDDWERGRAAVEELERSLGEYRAELPPAHTPLSQVFAESDVDEEETKKLDR
ncbi:MAG: hypothetical protein KF831_03030 [Acidobacteria bacterium]|nr:hypothetical protein [Acidobacteriota bacterium]